MQYRKNRLCNIAGMVVFMGLVGCGGSSSGLGVTSSKASIKNQTTRSISGDDSSQEIVAPGQSKVANVDAVSSVSEENKLAGGDAEIVKAPDAFVTTTAISTKSEELDGQKKVDEKSDTVQRLLSIYENIIQYKDIPLEDIVFIKDSDKSGSSEVDFEDKMGTKYRFHIRDLEDEKSIFVQKKNVDKEISLTFMYESSGDEWKNKYSKNSDAKSLDQLLQLYTADQFDHEMYKKILAKENFTVSEFKDYQSYYPSKYHDVEYYDYENQKRSEFVTDSDYDSIKSRHTVNDLNVSSIDFRVQSNYGERGAAIVISKELGFTGGLSEYQYRIYDLEANAKYHYKYFLNEEQTEWVFEENYMKSMIQKLESGESISSHDLNNMKFGRAYYNEVDEKLSYMKGAFEGEEIILRVVNHDKSNISIKLNDEVKYKYSYNSEKDAWLPDSMADKQVPVENFVNDQKDKDVHVQDKEMFDRDIESDMSKEVDNENVPMVDHGDHHYVSDSDSEYMPPHGEHGKEHSGSPFQHDYTISASTLEMLGQCQSIVDSEAGAALEKALDVKSKFEVSHRAHEHLVNMVNHRFNELLFKAIKSSTKPKSHDYSKINQVVTQVENQMRDVTRFYKDHLDSIMDQRSASPRSSDQSKVENMKMMFNEIRHHLVEMGVDMPEFEDSVASVGRFSQSAGAPYYPSDDEGHDPYDPSHVDHQQDMHGHPGSGSHFDDHPGAGGHDMNDGTYPAEDEKYVSGSEDYMGKVAPHSFDAEGNPVEWDQDGVGESHFDEHPDSDNHGMNDGTYPAEGDVAPHSFDAEEIP